MRVVVWLSSLMLVACGVDRTGLGGPDASADLGSLTPDLGPPRPDLGGGPADLGTPPTDLGMGVDMPTPIDLGPPPVDLGPTCDPTACRGHRCLDDATCGFWASCDELLTADGSLATGVYPLDVDGPGGTDAFDAFCEMSADGGGWTLVLKVDGRDATTFEYSASLWTNDTLLSETSLDYSLTQAKLQAYTRVAMNDIRIGFLLPPVGGGPPIDGSAATYVVVDPTDNTSFKQLMHDGDGTIGTADEWVALVPGAAVQDTGRITGADIQNDARPRQRVLRLGLIGDDTGTTCPSPDSFVGIGAETSALSLPWISAGNWARWNGTVGDRTLPAWAFVFVK